MYEFKVSTRKNKKYDVYKNGKYLVSFGAIKTDGTPYEQYYDKIGSYSKYNHNDNKRKDNYYKRHGKAKFESAKYFSHKYLW
jgi:hypothetical protein